MSTPWFLPAPLVDVAALALWWGLLRLSRRRDNRRLRNGLLFLLLVGATVRALHHLASLIPALKLPVGLGNAAFFLLIALMPFLLMFNGVVLIRREGRRLSNLLCLAAGLGLIATPMAAVALVATGSPWALLVAALMFCACAYLGVFLLIFLGQTVVQRICSGSGVGVGRCRTPTSSWSMAPASSTGRSGRCWARGSPEASRPGAMRRVYAPGCRCWS